MDSSPKIILFVCTGNTCRSPMAEGLFNQLLKEQNLEELYLGCSAGVSAFSGDPANPHTLNTLLSRNISLSHFRSTPISSFLLDDAHLIIAMTSSHSLSIQELSPHLSPEKIALLSQFDPSGKRSSSFIDLADPIGKGLNTYQQTATLMHQHLSGLLLYLQKKPSTSM